jgi:hypothetical protein
MTVDEWAKRSLVKIKCKQDQKVGSGFAWQESTQIVTALHVVAGCRKNLVVIAEHPRKRTSKVSDVPYVLLKSDLAVLALERDIDLEPLNAFGTAAPGRNYDIWGYPKPSKSMAGDPVAFSKVSESISTLSHLMEEHQYRAEVGVQGYPEFTAPILRIGSTMRPGHSGGPIIDADGRLVAIGDGGLYGGTARVNWAIPSDAIEELLRTRDPWPTQRPNSRRLMSSGDDAEGKPIILPGGVRFEHSMTETWRNVIDRSALHDADFLLDRINTAIDFTGIDFIYDKVEIYEHYETGATIGIPVGGTPQIFPGTDIVHVTLGTGRIEMYIKVGGGVEGRSQYVSFVSGLAEDWRKYPHDESEIRVDEPGFQHAMWTRYSGDLEDPTASLSAGVTVDRDNFLGTAMVTHYPDRLTREEIAYFYLAQMVLATSGFVIY